MSDVSNTNTSSAGASLPKTIEEKRTLAAKARKIHRDRKVRWKRLVDALEEKALKLASDDACDLLALVRLGTLVKECRETGNRERAASYSRSMASRASAGTMTDVPTNGTGKRALTAEVLQDIEVLAKLM